MPLHPQVKQMLEQLYASGWKDVSDLTVLEARAQSDYYAGLRQFPQPLPQVAVTDFHLPREQQQNILLRVYQPQHASLDAAIIYYHGGGYVLSSVQHYDTLCRWMCDEMGTTVISVDYRLAPEYPFPTPIEDGYAALEWVAENADKLHIAGKKLVVAGDSAGAHLATMVSILSRDRSGPQIAWQWLIYPWVDNDLSRASYQTYAEGYALTTRAMQWFDKHFLQNSIDMTFPAYPFQVSDLAHLPPAFIISAECDPLHDEAYAYSKRLKDAGNVVHYEFAPGMIHGFLNHYALPVSFDITANLFDKFKGKLNEHVLHQESHLKA